MHGNPLQAPTPEDLEQAKVAAGAEQLQDRYSPDELRKIATALEASWRQV
jgi:hypothetical protein